ncbi:MAG: type I DNA topoisomerase [Bacillota bacterium]|nr:type I DNA topoisomerase [Bacillota bacterium]
MAQNLIIVESPTKAKTIGKMLGKSYKVVASVGHVRDLPKSTLGVDIENDFEPKYINIRGKGPLIKDLKKEAKAAKNVYLATDNDREGEAISWHLAYILGLDPAGKNRISFNEITKDAVKSSLKAPRTIDQDLVDAQQGRRILDRLVGYKISPILWKKVKSGLSAGRVQSAVVKIISDREEEIENFIPEEYWSLDANLKAKAGKFKAAFYGKLAAGKEEKVELKSQADVEAVKKALDQNNFLVKEVKLGERTRAPRPPYTTSTLQQEASRYINFPGRKTMQVAQQLYEGINLGSKGTTGLITYMRTDSVNISDQARAQARTYILDNYGKDYDSSFRKFKSKAGAQEAHECIRPTDVFLAPLAIKEFLTNDQYKLYKLIWERFMASLMAAAKFDTINASIYSNDQIFKATGSNLAFDGFLLLKNKADQDEKENKLPKLVEGEKLKLEDLQADKHFTKAPPRYTEASLIKTLEELGIGRPSTYAPTISTITKRNYVELEDKKFVPTELGLTVNSQLTEYFPMITDKDFTAKMEDELDKISVGQEEWKEVIRDFYKEFQEKLAYAEKEMEKVELKPEVTDEICDKCGANMVIKMGRFGKFLACPNFPECRNTKPLLEKIGLKCPKCKDGEIIKKRSKKGRVFYGCSSYPDCDFVSWGKPIDKKCPVCGSLLTEPTTKRGKNYTCSNPECSYKEAIKSKED